CGAEQGWKSAPVCTARRSQRGASQCASRSVSQILQRLARASAHAPRLEREVERRADRAHSAIARRAPEQGDEMIAAFILYALAISAIVRIVALLLDKTCAAMKWPRRAAWLGAMLL